jgi:hypothetical protein
MNDVLQFNSQQWKLWRSEGLNLFLPRSTEFDRVYFDAEWTFVRPEVTHETFTFKQPQFHLSVIGCVPDFHDWRDLANRTLADNGDSDDDSDDELNLLCGGPDLFAYPPDADPKTRPDGWGTQLSFGGRDEYEFEFEMEASRLSDRAHEANRTLQVKQLLGEKLPPDWEGRDWLDEGDRLTFSGRIRLEEILCNVPINTGQPIEWAKQLTRKELKFEEFGFCNVNGGDHFSGKFKPDDGIGEEGRLVVLNVADDYFYEWQRRQKQSPKA